MVIESNGSTPEIVGMGHALLDSIYFTQDHIISSAGLRKGEMNLVTPEIARRIEEEMSAAGAMPEHAPGGSISNSLAVASAIGANTALICRTGSDRTGEIYRERVSRFGLQVIDPAAPGHTGRCLVAVTPDAERTMATTLGDSPKIPLDHALHPAIRSACVFAFDGYMLDNRRTKGLVLAATLSAKLQSHSILIATSLGTVESAARNAAEIMALARRNLIDVLFGNEEEMQAFFDSSSEVDTSHFAGGVFITRGKEGVIWKRGGHVMAIPAKAVTSVVDTTGAGDAFAGGALFGLARYADPRIAAEIGLAAAAEIIQQKGALPTQALAHLDSPSELALRNYA